MAKISATIITYNEASRIRACLDSLCDIADEIIVIDSGSTDSTVEICHEYGCMVRRRPFTGYGAQRQYATSLASHPYVLAIDADEVLSPALRASILDLKERGFDHRVYAFARLNFYCGSPVRHCGWYPDVQVRLFDKRYAGWDLRDVSERVIFRDSVRPERLDGDLLHYRCATHRQFAVTERRHACLHGRVIAASRNGVSAVKPWLAGIGAFVDSYLLLGGVLDGAAGRDIAVERFRCELFAHRLARRIINRTKRQQS